MSPPTLFLLSPARCGSVRALQLLDARSSFELAQQLQSPDGAGLGDVFAWLSSLYFRGKLLYSRAFARPPTGVISGVYVITPGQGLALESQRITVEQMRSYAEVDVHHANERFTGPLLRDAHELAMHAGPDARFVLLGSIASAKYLAPLQHALGGRLLFPASFVGRGDMSRGGLLLRAVREQLELDYVPVEGAVLHGPRPPRLARLAPKR